MVISNEGELLIASPVVTIVFCLWSEHNNNCTINGSSTVPANIIFIRRYPGYTTVSGKNMNVRPESSTITIITHSWKLAYYLAHFTFHAMEILTLTIRLFQENATN